MDRKRRRILHLLVLVGFQMVCGRGEEAVTPLSTPSAPEGNTTFVSGTTWCVALTGVTPHTLQTALDWACGPGSTDCSALQPGGPCFEPNDLLSHASFAFNSYYQQNGNNDIACNFGGAAIITAKDPSYASCRYLASESSSGSSWSLQRRNSNYMGLRLLWYFVAYISLI